MTAFAQISLWGEDCVVRLSRRGLRLSARGKRGRPGTKPPEIDSAEWIQYTRYRRKALAKRPQSEPLAFEAWMRSTEPYRDRGRRGGLASREKNVQVIEWITIIPRRDLIKRPEIEMEWHKRLYYSSELVMTHRVHLRGIQKRVSR